VARGSHRGLAAPSRTVRGVGRFLAAALSAALLVGFGYGWYEYRSLDRGLQRIHLNNLGKPPAGGTSESPQVQGRAQNILIVGVDSREGLSAAERRLLSVGDATSLSADTIMVIHVPADGRRATMISIPRDSFVDIPGGFLKNKINAAYADGWQYNAPSGASANERRTAGADVLVGAVSKLTGLQIDHYVQVGFGGFYTIAKAIHGITVNLCQATDDTHAYNEAHGLGPVGSNFKMSAGRHKLTPVQALEFVRQRHNLRGGDLGRERRQQYFLTAAFDKIASAGVLLHPTQLNALIKAITGTFYVDDNGFNLIDLANQMADLSANKITGYTIPTDGSASRTVAGVSESVELVSPAKVQAFVRRVLNGAGATGSPRTSQSSTSQSGTSHSPAPRTPPANPPTKGCVY
jgi:LCP family protein required for cell wall assembly